MTEAMWVHCYYCGREFRDKTSLKFHIKLHAKAPEGNPKICCLCEKTFVSKNDVLQHYSFDHGVQTVPRSFEFGSFEVFLKWKRKIEKATRTRFVIKRGTRVNKAGARLIGYCCHRDSPTCQERFVYEVGNKKQKLGEQPRYNRINIHCPATMKVIVLKDGRVSASYVDTHVGHAIDVQRMKISWANKSAIAKMMKAGASYDEIIGEFLDKRYSDPRLEVLDTNDLNDIGRQFNVKRVNSKPGRTNDDKSKKILNKKLSTINSIWEEIEMKIENVDEAEFVLKTLPPILSTLKAMKRERLRELLVARQNDPTVNTQVDSAIEAGGRPSDANEPPPLVFYPKKPERDGVKVVAKRKFLISDENESPALTRATEVTQCLRIPLNRLIIPTEPPGLVPMSRKKNSTVPVDRENSDLNKMAGSVVQECDIKHECVELEFDRNIKIESCETLVGAYEGLTKNESFLVHGGNTSKKTISCKMVVKRPKGENTRKIKIPPSLEADSDIESQRTNLVSLDDTGCSTREANLSEPPPLVFLPSKLATPSDQKKPPVLPISLAKTSQPTIPVKVARQEDVNNSTSGEPPKLVLIPNLAEKLMNNKQLCLRNGNGYLIRKLEAKTGGLGCKRQY